MDLQASARYSADEEQEAWNFRKGAYKPVATMDGLLNLVGATCVSPVMRTWMHSILPCSTLTQRSSQYELYRIGRNAMRLDAIIFLQFDIALFHRFCAFRFLQRFRLLQLFNMPATITYSSPFLFPTIVRRQLCPIRCTGATVHKYPCGCRRSHCCRRILTLEKKSWRSTSPPQLCTCSYQPPPTPPMS